MLCRMGKNIHFHVMSTKSLFYTTKSARRCLFSQAALGIENFIKARERVNVQFFNLADDFRSKMTEFTHPDSNNMIFTDDLKSMVHLLENKSNDVELLLKMISKFNRQNKELRFGSFVFGPVIMRAFHHLNLPKVALQVFKDPELDGFFDQLISFQILMDLLYNNSMYEEIIEVFNIVNRKQIHGTKYPKNTVLLVMAACYKLNTKEHLDYAIKEWKKMVELGHTPVRRAVTFASALAINQNSPHVALEILSCTQHPNYVTVRNLKVAALSDLGRPEDAIPVLRNVIETDIPVQKKQTFTKDVMERLKKAVQEKGNKDLEKEFSHLERVLIEGGHISDKDIDYYLCSEIAASNMQGRLNEDFSRTNLTSSLQQRPQVNYRSVPPRHYRPSLRDME